MTAQHMSNKIKSKAIIIRPTMYSLLFRMHFF